MTTRVFRTLLRQTAMTSVSSPCTIDTVQTTPMRSRPLGRNQGATPKVNHTQIRLIHHLWTTQPLDKIQQRLQCQQQQPLVKNTFQDSPGSLSL
jgi:hypothetical protein